MGTADFIINRNGAHHVYDIVTICEAADQVAQLFAAGKFGSELAVHASCEEIDRFVALMVAVDLHHPAEDLLVTHMKADGCTDVHTCLHQPDPPARRACLQRR
jgi:hypothetical protein